MKKLASIVIIAVISFFENSQLSAMEEAAQTSSTNSNQSTSEANPPNNNAFKDLISNAPADADVFIIEPKDGATVSSPVTLKFGIANMSVAKAGDDTENSGHHHLLIDIDELPAMDAPLPASDNLIHFGGAQTEATIELEAGEHSLQLLLGNYLHIPHDTPVLSKKITITVE